MENKICCPVCRLVIRNEEEVKLDIINTITHQECEWSIDIKESGTFEEIVNKYPVLNVG